MRPTTELVVDPDCGVSPNGSCVLFTNSVPPELARPTVLLSAFGKHVSDYFFETVHLLNPLRTFAIIEPLNSYSIGFNES